ncbi:hypothetical protein [Candidatus Colwellia aromaticivorans]|uniref:hypothetical protein n=1 Tax=Candidatus Colwellia aromaticivorans TaxID=2267621 RepID=UPI000DF4B640|nr:hypothetical protein [Candidatus Colwellia aromaticivorans]
MKKLEHKLLPCVFCTIGLNCYVVGHNLVHASVQKLMNPKNKESVANDEQYDEHYTVLKSDDRKLPNTK